MIKTVNLTKDYVIGSEISQILKKVSITINKGDFVGIIGPSGCGKSTLMHIIGLLDEPTSGDIFIDDINVARLSDNERSKIRSEKIGFIFQQFNLIDKLTVLENILLPVIYSRKTLKYDPKQKALELLKKFGIEHRKDYFPNRISGGQQQRVAIARALIMNPSIILADEPTGNLDSKTGTEILNLLGELNSESGVTIAIITHDKEIAAKTKKKIFMKDGIVVKNL
jgi:putative ABC transport system ATP-binding protein